MTASSESLSRFAAAADTSSRRAALVELVKTKQISKVRDTESFRLGLERLADSARDGDSESDRVLAVATLQRAWASARPIRNAIASLMSGAVVRPLSNLHELDDVDDRRYAAESWRVAPSAWRPEVLAVAAALEESGEAVRKECIAGVVELAADLSEAIAALRKALVAVRFETKKPGDSFGRRLTRVIRALTETLAGVDMEVGENAGRELSELLDRGSRTAGRPESPAVRADVVEQVARLTHAIVRLDFLHGGREKTYEALSVVSEWFAAHEWQETCAASEAMSFVSRDVQRSLLLLAEKGVTDDRLRRALATVSGSRRNADAICRALATEHPGIPDDARDWLAGVSKRTQIASAVESQERSIDEVLGELLLVMKRLARIADLVRSDVLPEVSIVLPQQVRALSRLTGLAETMNSKLSLAVKWRSLRLRGTVGQEVEFSPVEHQLDADGVRSRRVRLLSPVVERISEDGVPRVVLKAAVEPSPGRQGPVVEAGGVSP